MIKNCHLLIIALCLACSLKGQERYFVTFDCRNLTFEEFVGKAESDLGIKFFYKPEWISDLRISENSRCGSLNIILDSLFAGKNLHYLIDNSGNVVVTGQYEVLILRQPGDYTDRKPLTLYINTAAEFENEEVRTMFLGNPSERGLKGNVKISGHVRNNDTNEPIEGVNVFIKKLSLGAISDRQGFYTISVPRGLHQIQFSYMGMIEKRINLNLYGTGVLNVDMDSKLVPLKEVIVSTSRSSMIDIAEAGVEKIDLLSLRSLPTSLGEADLLKNLSLIPGVQSAGEGSSGFNVRGGAEDQNLILLYGAPVYNPSHFFGFFSSINSDIIEATTLYKGGIPARFGGRISSVLDITAKDGNGKTFRGNAGISPIAAHLSVEGPVIKDTLSYMLNLRTTYSDWILHLIDLNNVHFDKASFNDINGKLTYKAGKNDKFSLSAYFSNDNYLFNSGSGYKYRNLIAAVEWQHIFSPWLSSALSIQNSGYKYEITSNFEPLEAYVLSHSINTTGTKGSLRWLKGNSETIAGFEINIHSVMPGSYYPSGDSSLVAGKTPGNERAIESSLFIEENLRISSKLSLHGGLRLSSFLSFGPETVLLYNPEFSRSNFSTVDSIKFGKWQTTSRYAVPEFRFSVNFRLSDYNSVKISYNRTSQYIHQLSNTLSVSPSATWKLCDYYLKPETGDQIGIGLYRILKRNGIEGSAEVYYKKINNMVEFKGGSTLTMVENIEQYVIDLSGKAYGVELELRKSEGRFNYSLAYSYARSLVRSTSSIRSDIINSGRWYPSNYDKPNSIAITMLYSLSKRLSISADYVYSTGRPVTYPLSRYYLNNKFLFFYSDRNQYRIPDYSRLDASLRLRGNLRIEKIANPNLVFSVYNLTGRENVYSVFFTKNGSKINSYKMSVFSRPFPTLTFSFDF